MMGISEYLLAGVAAAAIVSGGYGYFQKQKAENTELKLSIAQGELATCGARLLNILEDKESDNAIDSLPDGALTTVPDHWLLPE